MFSSGLSLPAISPVLAAAAATDNLLVAATVNTAARVAEEQIPLFSIWHYILGHSRHPHPWWFRLMHLDGDRPQVRDESDVPLDTVVRAWHWRQKYCGFNGVSLLCVTDRTADMTFLGCYEGSCYVERLFSFVARFGGGDTIPHASLSVFVFRNPFDCL